MRKAGKAKAQISKGKKQSGEEKNYLKIKI